MISKSNAAKPDYMKQKILGKLKRYTVPDGVTEILPRAFYCCGYNNYHYASGSPIAEEIVIYLPDSVTSIGEYACCGITRNLGNTSLPLLHTIPHIPQSVVSIGTIAFSSCKFPNGFILPNTVTSLARQGVVHADIADIPGSIKELTDQMFTSSKFKTVILRNGIQKLNGRAFEMNTSLKTASLPNSIIYTNPSLTPFAGCSSLEFVTLEQGFNASIKLNNSTKYSHDTILSWFNALYDRSSTATNTLTMGSTNLAKMSAQEIAIATAKNWTIA